MNISTMQCAAPFYAVIRSVCDLFVVVCYIKFNMCIKEIFLENAESEIVYLIDDCETVQLNQK